MTGPAQPNPSRHDPQDPQTPNEMEANVAKPAPQEPDASFISADLPKPDPDDTPTMPVEVLAELSTGKPETPKSGRVIVTAAADRDMVTSHEIFFELADLSSAEEDTGKIKLPTFAQKLKLKLEKYLDQLQDKFKELKTFAEEFLGIRPSEKRIDENRAKPIRDFIDQLKILDPKQAPLKPKNIEEYSLGKLTPNSPFNAIGDKNVSVTGESQNGKFAAMTHLGLGYKYEKNEDGFIILDHSSGNTWLISMDAIGSALNGHIVNEVFGEALAKGLISEDDFLKAAQSGIRSLNLYVEQAIRKLDIDFASDFEAHQNDEEKLDQEKYDFERKNLGKSGLCIAAAQINQNTIQSYHCGDSKLTIFRDGNLIFATKDHSHVQEQIDSNIYSEDEAFASSKKNIIKKSIRPKSVAEVEVTKQPTQELKANDLVILASDGVFDFIKPKEFEAIVNKFKDAPVDQIRDRIYSAVTKLLKKQIGYDYSRRNKHFDDNINIIVYRHKPE